MSKPGRRPGRLVSGAGKLWHAIRNNLMIKLLCLMLAGVVWQAARENTSFEMVLADIPVSVTAGEGWAVFDRSTDTVSIRFRGSREDIRYLNSSQVSVAVDISGQTDRLRQTVKFTPRLVTATTRAQAVQFSPEEITLTIDREVERALPVRAVFDGNLPPGIQMEKTASVPASVRVRGAEQLLSELEQVRTFPVSLDGRVGSFKTQVALAAAGQPWSVQPDRVTVEVTLVERIASRRFDGVSVRPLLRANDPRSVEVRPETVSVVLRGSPQAVESLNLRDVVAYVDCAGLESPAEYEVQVRADVPAGVTLEKMDPLAVRVTVK